jgi:predicted nuclease of predicted toxin-antitoxin system
MKLRDFGLLTDENLDPDVVQWLETTGFPVLDVCRAGLQGTTDVELMRQAFAENRVIVTHDADFGSLAVLQGKPVVGLVFLRPGHINPDFTIGTLMGVLQADPTRPQLACCPGEF